MLAVAALAAGQLGGGLLFGGLALLTVWVFSLWRQQIDLATRLLGVSAHGLAANSGVIGATVLLNVASLVAIAPLGVLAAFALSNGDPAPNPAREGRQQCVDAAGQEVPCCTWNPNAFAQAYMGAWAGGGGLLVGWGTIAAVPADAVDAHLRWARSLLVRSCLRSCPHPGHPPPRPPRRLRPGGGAVDDAAGQPDPGLCHLGRGGAGEVGFESCGAALGTHTPGAVPDRLVLRSRCWTRLTHPPHDARLPRPPPAVPPPQWYFAPASLSGPPRGTTLRSLKHALGPSFGSLCLSSLVLTVSQMMREALEQAQDEGARQGSALMVVLACCAQLFWSLVEYLTKFATVFAAITGDAFLEAGRRVTDLLARNFLNAFASTVW